MTGFVVIQASGGEEEQREGAAARGRPPPPSLTRYCARGGGAQVRAPNAPWASLAGSGPGGRCGRWGEQRLCSAGGPAPPLACWLGMACGRARQAHTPRACIPMPCHARTAAALDLQFSGGGDGHAMAVRSMPAVAPAMELPTCTHASCPWKTLRRVLCFKQHAVFDAPPNAPNPSPSKGRRAGGVKMCSCLRPLACTHPIAACTCCTRFVAAQGA